MVFKRSLILYLIFINLVGFAQSAVNQYCLKRDTISIYSSILPQHHIYTNGLRLFPDPCLNDEEAFKIAEKTKVYLILEKSDTLYIFTDELEFFDLPDLNNSNIRDSVFKDFSTKFKRKDSVVNVTLKLRIFSNHADSIVIVRETGDCFKNGVYFSWYHLKVSDTLFKLVKLRYGLSKSNFFKNTLRINFLYPNKNFVVFIGYFKSNKLSWYYKQYCNHNTRGNDLYCKGNTINSNFFIIDFKNNQIVEIKAYVYP